MVLVEPTNNTNEGTNETVGFWEHNEWYETAKIPVAVLDYDIVGRFVGRATGCCL